MEKQELKRLNIDSLPWFYKLLLKIPMANVFEGASSGIFWAIIVPCFLAVEFFLSIFLLVYFVFPINIIIAGMIPATIFLIFVRISLERFINWWNGSIDTGFKWNVERMAQEYIDSLKPKKEEKEA
ncbi:hypothetical protein MUO74_00820 [Candidatus Bathyarchaeota archaeon]|nr:hypothetical protein [Candidatus Bathyarchaeota archaeon]